MAEGAGSPEGWWLADGAETLPGAYPGPSSRALPSPPSELKMVSTTSQGSWPWSPLNSQGPRRPP